MNNLTFTHISKITKRISFLALFLSDSLWAEVSPNSVTIPLPSINFSELIIVLTVSALVGTIYYLFKTLNKGFVLLTKALEKSFQATKGNLDEIKLETDKKLTHEEINKNLKKQLSFLRLRWKNNQIVIKEWDHWLANKEKGLEDTLLYLQSIMKSEKYMKICLGLSLSGKIELKKIFAKEMKPDKSKIIQFLNTQYVEWLMKNEDKPKTRNELAERPKIQRKEGVPTTLEQEKKIMYESLGFKEEAKCKQLLWQVLPRQILDNVAILEELKKRSSQIYHSDDEFYFDLRKRIQEDEDLKRQVEFELNKWYFWNRSKHLGNGRSAA